MNTYNLSYTLGFEQEKKLSNLVMRCREINGWGEQELLQHAATANSKAEIDLKLDFLADEVIRFENQFCIQTAKEQLYISDEEHAACLRVADAFSEMYSADLLVLDAGRYGFVKLQYFHPPFGYDETSIFTTGKDLFNDLWYEWLSSQILDITEDTPLAEINYQDILRCLPAEKQQEFMDKRDYFLDRSGISL